MYRNKCAFQAGYGQCPVVWRDDYNLRYEFVPETGFPPPHNEAIFIHSEVYRWNKSVRAAYLKDLDTVLELLGQSVFCHCNPEDSKFVKFVTMCGFEPFPDYMVFYGGRWLDVWKR